MAACPTNVWCVRSTMWLFMMELQLLGVKPSLSCCLSLVYVLLLQIGCSYWEPLTYPDLSFKYLKILMWHHHICCFRFSGLTADNFKNVDTCLKDVQAILLDMFQEDTVLIGHSLNSDLIALKVLLQVIYVSDRFFVCWWSTVISAVQ